MRYPLSSHLAIDKKKTTAQLPTKKKKASTKKMSAKPFHVLSICLGIIFVIVIVSLVFSGMAITRDTSNHLTQDLLIDGSSPMQASLFVDSIVPTTTNNNLGISQRSFANTFTDDPVIATFIQIQNAQSGDLLMSSGSNIVTDSSISASDFANAPFMPLTGGSMTGTWDLGNHSLNQVNSWNGKDASQVLTFGNPSINGRLVNLIATYQISPLSLLASNVVTALTNITAGRIAKFSTGKQLVDSGFIATNVVRDSGSSVANNIVVWSGQDNLINDLSIPISSAIVNSELVDFMPYIGGIFTQPFRYPRSSVASPSMCYAHSPLSPLKNISMVRGQYSNLTLTNIAKVNGFDPQNQFDVKTDRIDFIGTFTPEWYRVKIVFSMNIAAPTPGLVISFSVRSGINDISYRNTASSNLGFFYVTYETLLQFSSTDPSIFYRMRVSGPAGANVIVSIADFTVVIASQ